MTFRLALRALLSRPIRSGVLACGFGLGVSVMASLLGIGEVILEQARSPALGGGGDAVIGGVTGNLSSAKFVLSHVLTKPPLDQYGVLAASPTSTAELYLLRDGRSILVRAKGGIPSLERALGDVETADVSAWTDSQADAAWVTPEDGDILRAMDRFHPIPDVPHRANSWAEWLYFNGRAGDTRFYLTFLVGPKVDSGDRAAGVRLQLDHDGRMRSYSDSQEIDEATLLADAPDIVIGRSRVRLDGDQYRISVDLPLTGSSTNDRPGQDGPRVTGQIVLVPAPGRAFPPLTIPGANGWLTGYVVPVLAGSLDGTLSVDGELVDLSGGRGYHDHNWGFWEGVSWKWGQVQSDDLSLIYGRVYPPPDAADPERMPGFLAALGPDGPLAYTTRVTIDEYDDVGDGRPDRIVVQGSSRLDLTMELDVENAEVTRMDRASFGSDLDFLQLRVTYHVFGTIGEEPIDFTAPGSAETFRER